MTFCAWLPFQTTLWSPVPESIYGGAARPDKEAKELITYSTSGPAAIWMICMTPLILMVLVRPGSLPGPLLLLVRKENAPLNFFFYGVDLILCYFILSNVNWFSFISFCSIIYISFYSFINVFYNYLFIHFNFILFCPWIMAVSRPTSAGIQLLHPCRRQRWCELPRDKKNHHCMRSDW